MSRAKANPEGVYYVGWGEVRGVRAMRIPGSVFFAVPSNEIARSMAFDMMETMPSGEREFRCIMMGSDASKWLCARAREEGVPSNFVKHKRRSP